MSSPEKNAPMVTYESWDKSSTKLEWHGILPKNMRRWNREEMIDLEGVTQDMIDSLEAVNWEDPNMADQFVHDEEVRMDATETNRGSRAALAYKKDRSDGTISCLYVRVNVTFKLVNEQILPKSKVELVGDGLHKLILVGPLLLCFGVLNAGSRCFRPVPVTFVLVVMYAASLCCIPYLFWIVSVIAALRGCGRFFTTLIHECNLWSSFISAFSVSVKSAVRDVPDVWSFLSESFRLVGLTDDDERHDDERQTTRRLGDERTTRRLGDTEDCNSSDGDVNEDVLKLIEVVFSENGFQM